MSKIVIKADPGYEYQDTPKDPEVVEAWEEMLKDKIPEHLKIEVEE
jgi:hypothetical protein